MLPPYKKKDSLNCFGPKQLPVFLWGTVTKSGCALTMHPVVPELPMVGSFSSGTVVLVDLVLKMPPPETLNGISQKEE